MIKINLLAEKKQTKAKKSPTVTLASEGGPSASQNLMLVGILLIGAVIAGLWWNSLRGTLAEAQQRNRDAQKELERLAEVRKKGDEFKRQKELLANKINLITELKRRQSVPVHILDKVSRNLPDFLWLESMSTNRNQVSISGKATNYNSVSSFYQNLTESGFFTDVELGRVFEVREGVAFSLTCRYNAPADEAEQSPQG